VNRLRIHDFLGFKIDNAGFQLSKVQVSFVIERKFTLSS